MILEPELESAIRNEWFKYNTSFTVYEKLNEIDIIASFDAPQFNSGKYLDCESLYYFIREWMLVKYAWRWYPHESGIHYLMDKMRCEIQAEEDRRVLDMMNSIAVAPKPKFFWFPKINMKKKKRQ